MDATALSFADESFDAVTAFYSLLFMTAGEQERAIAEGIRVLCPSGRLCLWDCVVESAYPNPFVTELDVDLEGELLHTSYGICKLDAQSRESILSFCLAKGLTLLTSRQEGNTLAYNVKGSKELSRRSCLKNMNAPVKMPPRPIGRQRKQLCHKGCG